MPTLVTMFMKIHVVALIAALGLPGWVKANPTPELGTLFYSPAERLEISRARESHTGVSATNTNRLTGVVARAGGKGTVWINNKPFAEGTPQAGQIQGVDAVVQGQRLRVGQAVDKLSGARSDVVAPGAVTVRRKP